MRQCVIAGYLAVVRVTRPGGLLIAEARVAPGLPAAPGVPFAEEPADRPRGVAEDRRPLGTLQRRFHLVRRLDPDERLGSLIHLRMSAASSVTLRCAGRWSFHVQSRVRIDVQNQLYANRHGSTR